MTVDMHHTMELWKRRVVAMGHLQKTNITGCVFVTASFRAADAPGPKPALSNRKQDRECILQDKWIAIGPSTSRLYAQVFVRVDLSLS